MASHSHSASTAAPEPQDLPPTLPYASIKLVFTDLDGTLFPGAYEEQPTCERRGLMRNMAEVARLEAMGVPVVPATGDLPPMVVAIAITTRGGG